MSKRLFVLLAALAALSMSLRPALAQAPISLGDYKAHPTRIIARYSEVARLLNPQATLQSLGETVHHRSELVPGLVVLDRGKSGRRIAPQSAGAAVDPRVQVDELLERIEALERTGLFEYVEPSYVHRILREPGDAHFKNGTLWGLKNAGSAGGLAGADIDVVRAWDMTTGSRDVIVAVIDTGIRYSHRELASQMWRNPGEIAGNGVDDDRDGYIDNVYGINSVTGSGDPFDDNDHGTHVAGTIGAAANDGNPHVGVAWQVQLMACKFLNAEGFGFTDDAITCIDFAVRKGARVLNASWGGGPFERALFDCISAAGLEGVLFVTAAGNDFNDNDSKPAYPASYQLDNVIAVAAMDRRDRLATFSNFGRSSVHLGAPGVEISSSTSGSDAEYKSFRGTSMAAPHVSGVAALILSMFPNASVSELRERLLSTAVSVPALKGKVRSGGRVSAYRALSAEPDGILEVSFSPPAGSDLPARRPIPFFVTVTDLASVTNAVVRVRLPGSSDDLLLLNDGKGPDRKANDEVYSAEITLPPNPGAFEIAVHISAPGKVDHIQMVTYILAVPPMNDNFADSIELPPEGITLDWSNRFATMEPGEPRHAKVVTSANSVWWRWKPDVNSRTIVDLAGSSFDTVLGIYTNSSLATLREIASVDDAGGLKQGYVHFDARAEVTYHVAVAGFKPQESGRIRLRIEPGGGPDTNAPQVVILTPPSGLVITNVDARVVITGAAYDPEPNSSGIKQVLVQANRELASTALGTTNWSSTVLLQEGQNRIKVIAKDNAGNSSPSRTVIVNFDPMISPNDHLTNAMELSGNMGSVSGDSTRGTKEPGEPQHAGVAGGMSIWWTFRPPVDGVLELSTANSSFDTLLALYTGRSSQMSALQHLASNDNAFPGAGFSMLTQAIKGGQTYYIAVDGAAGSSGLVQLAYEFVPGQIHLLSIDQSPGGTVQPGSGYHPANAMVSVKATPNRFFFFDRWEGSASSFENPLTLAMKSDLHLTPRFVPVEFSDGFETGGLNKLPWRSSGNAVWIVQTNVVQAGRFAARSGSIGNGQRSSLILTNLFRGGTGAFSLRVSCEPTWDKLDFYLNGKRASTWSGDVPWTNFQFSVQAGTNVLEWRYSKDFLDTTAGLDAAFIDNVDLPLVVPVDSTTPALLNVVRSSSGTLLLNLHGQINQHYVIQSSTDLRFWQPVLTNAASSGSIRWEDRSSMAGPHRFYRAIVPRE
jgi:subtilisin family serine protease